MRGSCSRFTSQVLEWNSGIVYEMGEVLDGVLDRFMRDVKEDSLPFYVMSV